MRRLLIDSVPLSTCILNLRSLRISSSICSYICWVPNAPPNATTLFLAEYNGSPNCSFTKIGPKNCENSHTFTIGMLQYLNMICRLKVKFDFFAIDKRLQDIFNYLSTIFCGYQIGAYIHRHQVERAEFL